MIYIISRALVSSSYSIEKQKNVIWFYFTENIYPYPPFLSFGSTALYSVSHLRTISQSFAKIYYWLTCHCFIQGISSGPPRIRRSSLGGRNGASIEAMEHRMPITVLQYNKALTAGLRSSPSSMKYGGRAMWLLYYGFVFLRIIFLTVCRIFVWSNICYSVRLINWLITFV